MYIYIPISALPPQQQLAHGISTKNLNLVKSALSQKAQPSQICVDLGTTPLEYACQKGYTAFVQTLLKEPGVKINQGLGTPGPLACAAKEGYLDCVKLLLKAKADPNYIATSYQFTPLDYAASSRAVNSYATTLLLIHSGVKLDVGYPLHNAIGNAKVVSLLIQHKADIEKAIPTDQWNEKGFRPLHKAAKQLDPPSVEILLKAGADAQAKSDQGETALKIAQGKLEEAALRETWCPTPQVSYANSSLARARQITALLSAPLLIPRLESKEKPSEEKDKTKKLDEVIEECQHQLNKLKLRIAYLQLSKNSLKKE